MTRHDKALARSKRASYARWLRDGRNGRYEPYWDQSAKKRTWVHGKRKEGGLSFSGRKHKYTQQVYRSPKPDNRRPLSWLQGAFLTIGKPI